MMNKIGGILCFAGLLLCLLQIWLPGYYVTGDGPCHLYNAQVLHDYWCNKNTAFYSQYYQVIYRADPNWLTTVALALLLFVVKGAIAEKILLSLYVMLYIGGVGLLLKKLSNGSIYWLLAVFIFVFPHTLAKGFYNFTFSIAFYGWVVLYWLRFLEKRNIANGLLFFLFTTLLFFTHLLAFSTAAMTCALLVVTYGLALPERASGFILKNLLRLTAFFTPYVIFAARFTEKEGGMQLSLKHHFYRLIELVQLKYFVNVTGREDVFALAAGITLVLLFGISLLSFRKAVINKYDGLLASLVLVLFAYLFFPEDFLGRLILITMRAQLLVALLMVCVIAYRLPAGMVKTAGAFVLFTCFLGMNVAQTACRLKASAATADYNSAKSLIKPYSVVLPLDFSPNGMDEHKQMIADRNYLFSHAAQYMGTEKPLVFIDNYEANMGYFPVNWLEKANPYFHLSKHEGIEGQPPYADIAEYKQTSGVTIDYVLMWCYDPAFLTNEHFAKLYAEIMAGYHQVYSSPTGRTILLEKNR
jgi:hypothetical protein